MSEVEKVIDQSIEKAIDEVKDKIEETVGKDADEIVAIVDEVATIAATVISSEVKEAFNELGIKMISESDMTEQQKKIAADIYEKAKTAIQSFISDQSVNNTIKITRTVGQVIRQLETATIEGKPITGGDKKIIAIHLGRILIKEVTPDDKGECEILLMYDLVAEPTLEAMIEVSKVVNTTIKEVTATCCPSLLAFFSRK